MKGARKRQSAQRAVSPNNTPLVANRLSVHGKQAANAARGLWRTPISSFATVFVIAIGLLLPSLLAGVAANLTSLLEEFSASAQISLFMEADISELELEAISEDLLTSYPIQTVRVISSSQAFAEFTEATGLTELSGLADFNPLPATLVISPIPDQPVALETLAIQLQNLAGVDIVQIDSEWIQRLAATSDVLSTISAVLGLIIFTGLFFIIGNTIKLAVENRREEIRVVKLVGGTDAFAARPFLYTGLFYGLAGGLLAALLQLVVLIAFNRSLQNLLVLYQNDFQLQGFGLGNLLLLIVAGSLIGWLAALLSSYRYILNIES